MYNSPKCPPPCEPCNPCKEPVRREQPTWCGPADCTPIGNVYDIQGMKPIPPCPAPGPGYMIPSMRPEIRNMTESQQVQELTKRVDDLTQAINDYSKNVYGAYNTIVNSALCNDAYYDEIKQQTGYIEANNCYYTLVDIPFVDCANQPIYLELALAYNNTQNMGVTEDILDASYHLVADKMVPASSGPFVENNITTGWDGLVFYGGAPISNPTHQVNWTIATTANGFIKLYPNTTDRTVMQNDRVMDAMGCMSVLVNNGVATPNLYGVDAGQPKARVAIGMNYKTKHRFILVTDGTDTIGSTSSDLSNIFVNLGCDVAAEVCTGAKAVGLDKGMFMYTPATKDDNGAPTSPKECAFWFITKCRHYKNQYVRDVAELTQNVGKQTWQATLANLNVSDMWVEVGTLNKKLTQEIADREQGDATLDAKIEQEISDREQAVSEISTKLEQEISDRTAADTALNQTIAAETEARTEADAQLQLDIENIKSDYLPLAGGTMTGPIDMNGQTIDSLPEPAEPDHATNKQYVDAGDAKLQEQVNAKLPKSGGTMTGAIMMNNQAVTGLPTPANPTDAVTKQYADDLKAQMLPSGGGTMSGAINMDNNTITALGAPVGDTDATNKEYVDGAITSAIKSAEEDADAKYLPLAGGTMTGPIKGLENPTENDEAANKAYVDAQVSGAGTTADGKYLALAGGTMTGPIAMGGQKITGAADPTENQDVATKAYVDGEIDNVGGTYLPIAGGTMTGPVEMGNNKITGLATPTENTDAATKVYVDEHSVGSGDYLQLSGGSMTGEIDMSGNSITGLPVVDVDESEDETLAVSIASLKAKINALESQLTEALADQFLSINGGNMNGGINMVGNTITGIKEPVNNSDAVNLAYVKEHINTDGYLPLEGGTMEGDVDMGNHVITSLQMPEGEDAGDAVNREFVNNYNNWYYKITKCTENTTGEIAILTTKLPEGIYLLNYYIDINDATIGVIDVTATYSDNQVINLGKYLYEAGHISTQTQILPGNCDLKLTITQGFDREIWVQYTLVKIGNTGVKTDDSPWPLPTTPTSDSLATTAVTQTALSLKNINYKVTVTPAETNNVFSGARVYYNTGSSVNTGGRTLIADLPSNLFSSNTYNGSFTLPDYNTQYYISVVSYYSGIEPELTKEGTGFAVTTQVSTPQPVTSFSVSPYSGVRVLAAWNNPSNVQNFNGVKIEYKTGSQAAWTPGTGTQIYQGTGTSAGAGQRSTAYLDMPSLSSQYTLMAYTYGSLTGTTQNSSTVIATVTTSGNQQTNVTSGRIVTVPAGYSKADVYLVGGGASGVPGNGVANQSTYGAGGGGGGYVASSTNLSVTPGASLTFSIGSGGATSNTTSGTNAGGTTSVSGAISLSANGGSKYGPSQSVDMWTGTNGGSGGGGAGNRFGAAGNGGSNGSNGGAGQGKVGSGSNQSTTLNGILYSGGGGGGNTSSSAVNRSSGGAGGGGAGGDLSQGRKYAPVSGGVNTGGGGGGGASGAAGTSTTYTNGASGGSGFAKIIFHN